LRLLRDEGHANEGRSSATALGSSHRHPWLAGAAGGRLTAATCPMRVDQPFVRSRRLSARRRELGNYRERSPPSNRRPAQEIRWRAQHSGSGLSRSLNPRNVRVAQGRSTQAQPQGDSFHRYRTCRLSGRLAWKTAHVHNQRPGCIPDRSRTNTRHFRSISHSPAASRRELSGYFGRPTRRVARR
jgi:hypothetical protein